MVWILRYPNFGFPCNISHMFLELGSVRKAVTYTFPALLFRYILSGIDFSIVSGRFSCKKYSSFYATKLEYFRVSIYTF